MGESFDWFFLFESERENFGWFLLWKKFGSLFKNFVSKSLLNTFDTILRELKEFKTEENRFLMTLVVLNFFCFSPLQKNIFGGLIFSREIFFLSITCVFSSFKFFFSWLIKNKKNLNNFPRENPNFNNLIFTNSP